MATVLSLVQLVENLLSVVSHPDRPLNVLVDKEDAFYDVR